MAKIKNRIALFLHHGVGHVIVTCRSSKPGGSCMPISAAAASALSGRGGGRLSLSLSALVPADVI
jgi:hypothetical protein